MEASMVKARIEDLTVEFRPHAGMANCRKVYADGELAAIVPSEVAASHRV